MLVRRTAPFSSESWASAAEKKRALGGGEGARCQLSSFIILPKDGLVIRDGG